MGDPVDYDALSTVLRNAFKEPDSTGMNVVSGLLAGVAGVIAGHPLDTIKVRLQSIQKGGSTFGTAADILKNEKIRGLYKGMSSPIIGVSIINATLFGVYGHLLGWQRNLFNTEEHNLAMVFVAGCGSGLANSVIACPSELAKIQLQNQRREMKYKGPWSCLKDIYRRNGVKGCFRGMSSTVLRETPSYGVYFLSFEAMKPWYGKPGDPAWKLMLAGGFSGVLGWLSTYPVDVAKTQIQSKTSGETSTAKTLKNIYTKEGTRGLFTGLNATLLRAFPTNAVIFYTYSFCMAFFNKQFADYG